MLSERICRSQRFVGAPHVDSIARRPLVVVSVLVRNQEYVLPTFLRGLELQDYPRDRILLHIRSDNNADNSTGVLRAWLRRVGEGYLGTDVELQDHVSAWGWDPPADWLANGDCEWRPHCWTNARYMHVAKLREQGLSFARERGAEFLFVVDADVFLIDPRTITTLIAEGRPIVAPLLHGFDAYQSNFWAGVDGNGYYKRTDRYMPIAHYQWRGVFEVPLVNSAYMVCMRYLDQAKLRYQAPDVEHRDKDSMMVFASSARNGNMPMYVLNTQVFGFTMPMLDDAMTYQEERRTFQSLKTRFLDIPNPASAFLLSTVIPTIAVDTKKLPSKAQLQDSSEHHRQVQWDAADLSFKNLCGLQPTFKDFSVPNGTCTAIKIPKLRFMNIWTESILQEPFNIKVFHNVITDEEAAYLIALARPRLKGAVVSDPETGEQVIADYRTSQVAWLASNIDPVVDRINTRLEALTGISFVSAEDLQINRYDRHGGKYEPHFDWQKRPHKQDGNRLATILIYLSPLESSAGGATIFTKENLAIPVMPLSAIFWYNLHPDRTPNYATQHAGCTVHSDVDEKWIANKWIHERGNRATGE